MKYLNWARDECNKVLNPNTGLAFKVGELFHDKRFKCYITRMYSTTNGPVSIKIPLWASEEAYQRRKQKTSARAQTYINMRTRNVSGLACKMLSNCRYRCKLNGGTCTLTKEWVVEQIQRGYVLNDIKIRDFDIQHDGNSTARSPWAPSLDRIDANNPNYDTSNVQVVPWAVNCARNEFSDDILIEVVGPYIDYIRARNKTNCETS